MPNVLIMRQLKGGSEKCVSESTKQSTQSVFETDIHFQRNVSC